MSDWRVLILEDDPAVARYHELLVSQTPTFTIVGIADSAEIATSMVEQREPHLLLLDLALPGRDGVAFLRQLRGQRRPIEVIAISANRNATTVRACAHLGVVEYLVKPFPPDRLRQALRLFVNRMSAVRTAELQQAQVDLLTSSGRIARRAVPKGLDATRVEQVRAILRRTDGLVSAQELSLQLPLSRVTVRRYLEYLAATGEAEAVPLPGATGRPRNGYRLHPVRDHLVSRQRRGLV